MSAPLFTATVGDPSGADPRSLEISARSFPGFQGAEITLSMDQLANGFSIDYAPNPGEPAQRPTFVGDKARIAVDGNDLLDGYIDETQDSIEGRSLQLSILGRSKTADLADSSCLIGKPARWRRADVRTIVQDICTPFGVDVTQVSTPGNPIRRFAAERGEFAGDVIRRAVSLRGQHAYTVVGDLVIARAGELETGTVLEEGFNLRRAERSHSHMHRHSEYRFRGQTAATDELSGLSAGRLRHTVTDPAVTRYRPLDLRAEGHTKEDMGKRAILERNRRAGQSETVVVEVDSPLMETGQPWVPNLRVPVRLPTLAVDATLLITTVRFRVTPRTVSTELQLSRPEAYEESDYPTTERGGMWQ